MVLLEKQAVRRRWRSPWLLILLVGLAFAQWDKILGTSDGARPEECKKLVQTVRRSPIIHATPWVRCESCSSLATLRLNM